jgi:hypothetical protein
MGKGDKGRQVFMTGYRPVVRAREGRCSASVNRWLDQSSRNWNMQNTGVGRRWSITTIDGSGCPMRLSSRLRGWWTVAARPQTPPSFGTSSGSVRRSRGSERREIYTAPSLGILAEYKELIRRLSTPLERDKLIGSNLRWFDPIPYVGIVHIDAACPFGKAEGDHSRGGHLGVCITLERTRENAS